MFIGSLDRWDCSSCYSFSSAAVVASAVGRKKIHNAADPLSPKSSNASPPRSHKMSSPTKPQGNLPTKTATQSAQRLRPLPAPSLVALPVPKLLAVAKTMENNLATMVAVVPLVAVPRKDEAVSTSKTGASLDKSNHLVNPSQRVNQSRRRPANPLSPSLWSTPSLNQFRTKMALAMLMVLDASASMPILYVGANATGLRVLLASASRDGDGLLSTTLLCNGFATTAIAYLRILHYILLLVVDGSMVMCYDEWVSLA